jgi:hypothetical protein
LERIQDLLNESLAIATNEKKGLLARLFKRHHVCKGMKGLIEEGESVIGEEMSPEVLDAAIIACAQKIEHYEICGYGTAKAFSLELGLHEVEQLLEQTLNEEYAADDRLTKLAVSRVNQKADSSPGKEAISKPDRPLANSQSSERSTMPKKEKAREMAPVSEQHNSVINKKAPTAKNKAPKGEAGRTETERPTVSESRIATNSKNSRPAKPSALRKTGEERNSTSKTKRSR